MAASNIAKFRFPSIIIPAGRKREIVFPFAVQVSRY